MVRPKSPSPRSATANVRLTADEREAMEQAAQQSGFTSISEYVRFLHSQWVSKSGNEERSHLPVYPAPKSYLSTKLGQVFLGDSLGVMAHRIEDKSVDLIVTSPPFGLVRKKSYGNEDADLYCEWFRPFAEGFLRILKDTGSLVIDIGGAWKPGMPTRSLYHFELLLMLCNEFGFHLCQEHYWWNPSKLPTPAEWVNVRRVRVKDAVNTVWWLSKTPYPKANNRRILAPYSDSMKTLLKHGYKAKLRPSGHDISTKFQKDNGGSVPPNLLAIANTESNSRYQEYCRENDFIVHPARFPHALPEYFIRFLTNRDDLVYDPFGGSCVTGEVCESLGRRWVTSEINEDFLRGAKARFMSPRSATTAGSRPYEIYPPCTGPDADDVPLFADGGA